MGPGALLVARGGFSQLGVLNSYRSSTDELLTVRARTVKYQINHVTP